MKDNELKKLAIFLEKLENQIFIDSGLKNISGGFVKAEMYDFDDNIIDIILKSGIQSDCVHNYYEENLKIDRKSFKIIN